MCMSPVDRPSGQQVPTLELIPHYVVCKHNPTPPWPFHRPFASAQSESEGHVVREFVSSTMSSLLAAVSENTASFVEFIH